MVGQQVLLLISYLDWDVCRGVTSSLDWEGGRGVTSVLHWELFRGVNLKYSFWFISNVIFSIASVFSRHPYSYKTLFEDKSKINHNFIGNQTTEKLFLQL